MIILREISQLIPIVMLVIIGINHIYSNKKEEKYELIK